MKHMKNRFSPGPADQRNQAALRHPERSIYRCFLTDLAGFTDICRVGPDCADRQDRKKTGLFLMVFPHSQYLATSRFEYNLLSQEHHHFTPLSEKCQANFRSKSATVRGKPLLPAYRAPLPTGQHALLS